MTIRTDKAQTTMDHELIVAERYRWWGVYLIREKRRLRGIAEAVQAEEAAAALKQQTNHLEEQIASDGSETPEELLTRVDTELGMTDALMQLASTESEGIDELDTSEGAIKDKPPIPEDRLRRKLAGRARLLASKQDDTEDEAF